MDTREHTHATLGSVRYLVDDVDLAVAFYAGRLGFALRADARPALAELVRGALRLLVSGPASTAGRPGPDGRTPAPGGWNRIHLVVDDLDAEVRRLRAAGVVFRNDVVTGPGGRQVLVEDPAGNPVELFEPAGA
ncbi:VOC family protein [Geodermatophilus sp. SYSU D00079]